MGRHRAIEWRMMRAAILVVVVAALVMNQAEGSSDDGPVSLFPPSLMDSAYTAEGAAMQTTAAAKIGATASYSSAVAPYVSGAIKKAKTAELAKKKVVAKAKAKAKAEGAAKAAVKKEVATKATAAKKAAI